ncbi:hypothetical protein [Ornithinicoccus hortensis]|uniref:Lipoprotein n=1 Tax=Ornithinicoccus hortensis TaxID=82346 RepID=A0A542YT16_9MICO|nr:hypothetical protein [Ornithinicoccus hortensis]TQL51239.1 hypothetical protein FB467_2379 [Ornithinicoccus hortensis]
MSVCRSVVAAVAMLLAASGCSAEKPQDVDVGNSETPPVQDTSASTVGPRDVALIGSGPSVLARKEAPDPSDGRHASAVQGSVGVSDGGCLVLVDEGDHAWTMVLPYGSELVDERVTLPNEEGFVVGDVVDLPGMWADPAAVVLPDDAHGCPTDGYALLFPPDAEDGSAGT